MNLVINVLYLSYNSVMTSGILQSQVLTLLQLLSKKYSEEISFTLVTLEHWDDYFDRERKKSFRKQLENSGIRVIILPKFLPAQLHYSNRKNDFDYKLFSLFLLLIDLKIVFWVSVWQVVRRKIRIVQARSYVPGLIGLFLKKLTGIKLVFDPRGLIPEELQLTQGWSEENPSFKRWKKIEKWLLQKSDAVIVLSEPFAEHYKKIVPALSPVIVPCCVDTERFIYDRNKRLALRAKNNFTDKFIVLYVMGHYVPYQDFDTASDLFNRIVQHIPSAHFLVLTPDIAQITNRLQKGGHAQDRYSVFKVSFAEIPDYILTADIGLLARVPSVISKVASPVKFAEYLACGVPVLAQPEIGDTEKVLTTRDIGQLIKDNQLTPENINWLKNLLNPTFRDELAKQCRSSAIHIFAWENYLSDYHNLYRQLSPK